MILIRKNKKGELTTQQLVTLIVLITSFVIILFLIFGLNFGQTTDNEICRNSVVLKGQSSLTSGPLDCKTRYVCISGGADCEAFSESEKINVDIGEEDDIMNVIAEEMAKCWYTFGEGEINYGEAKTGRVDYAICSIIQFDADVRGSIQEITYSDFYDYLRNTKKDEGKTYLQYLYGINEVSLFTPQPQVNVILARDKIFTNKKYSIITGIDNNIGALGINPDQFLKVYIIPTEETSARLVSGNKQFITKV